MDNELTQLREKIDYLDEQIVTLISKRLDICYEVGVVKRKNGVKNFLDKNRWQQILNSKKELGKKLNLDETFIEQVYELIHQYTLKIERENKR